MDLALKDIRRHLGKFIATIVGVAMLLTMVRVAANHSRQSFALRQMARCRTNRGAPAYDSTDSATDELRGVGSQGEAPHSTGRSEKSVTEPGRSTTRPPLCAPPVAGSTPYVGTGAIRG